MALDPQPDKRAHRNRPPVAVSPLMQTSIDSGSARLVSLSEEFLKIPFPKTVTEGHCHLGSAGSLEGMWRDGVGEGIRGIGDSDYFAFRDRFQFTPQSIASLADYVGSDIIGLGDSAKGKHPNAFGIAEKLQSSPDAMTDSVVHTAAEIFSFGGRFRSSPNSRRVPAYRVNRIELRFNPLKRTDPLQARDGKKDGFYDVDLIVEAAVHGARKIEIQFRNCIQVGLIICLARDFQGGENMIIAEKLARWRKEYPGKIIGIDLAGPEDRNPMSDRSAISELRKCYELAGKAGRGFGRTIHVGETKHVSLATFIKTIEAIQPDRVGHPIAAYRAFRDHKNDRGLKLLAERGILAELCPFSNLLTRALPDIKEFINMLNVFDRFGVRYSIGTDGPGFHNFTHADEMFHLFAHGMSAEQIVRAMEEGNKASFLPKKVFG